MKNFIRIFNGWWSIHEHCMATWATIIAIVELFIIILLFAAFVAQVSLLHDIEVLLTANGVEWALYTMP